VVRRTDEVLLRVIEGDLVRLALDGEFDVIVHGANCQCRMGAGITKLIKATFPEAFAADVATPKGSREKLGTISFATVQRGGHELVIVNAYTQFHSAAPVCALVTTQSEQQ